MLEHGEDFLSILINLRMKIFGLIATIAFDQLFFALEQRQNGHFRDNLTQALTLFGAQVFLIHEKIQ